MKFVVEFRIKPGSKNKAIAAFEERGPNRNPGVAFQGAWIGTRTDIVFALIESADESSVAKAAESWAEHGEYQIHPVIDIEQF